MPPDFKLLADIYMPDCEHQPSQFSFRTLWEIGTFRTRYLDPNPTDMQFFASHPVVFRNTLFLLWIVWFCPSSGSLSIWSVRRDIRTLTSSRCLVAVQPSSYGTPQHSAARFRPSLFEDLSSSDCFLSDLFLFDPTLLNTGRFQKHVYATSECVHSDAASDGADLFDP